MIDAQVLLVTICAVVVILAGCVMHLAYRRGGR